MTDFIQGQPAAFLANFFQYLPGGPPVDVTNLQITIYDLDTQTNVIGPTNVGITHPALGIFGWSWNPIPANQPAHNYAAIWTATETTTSENFTVVSSSSPASSSPTGVCADSWGVPTFFCDLSPAAQAVTGIAKNVAAEVLWSMSGRQVGECDMTIRPCASSCFGDWPFIGQWWQLGQYPRPLFYNGVWYNMTCGNGCGRSCSCTFVSEVDLPAPVTAITSVLVDGVLLPSTAYRVDDGRKLVRVDGGRWPMCNDLSKADTEVGTWSVSLSYGVPLNATGRLAWAELTQQVAKTLACDDDCSFGKPVQSVVRQGVTMTFLDPADLFPDGRLGLYWCDLFINQMNPNKLMSAASVYDVDRDGYRIAGDPA